MRLRLRIACNEASGPDVGLVAASKRPGVFHD